MDKRCGTCFHWQPEARSQIGTSMTYKTRDPICILQSTGGKKIVVKDAQDKPTSWCWLQASKAQIESRVKAGLIEGE